MACGAIAKLNLAGRQGSDRAAHSFEFHARPLLVMYLGRLLVTRTGKMPAENNTGFLELLSLTWEYATGESSAVGWQRHIRATDRDLVIPDGSGYSGISLSGSGPSTPLIFFSAYLQAGWLAREFQKALERRRYANRQKNRERRSSQD